MKPLKTIAIPQSNEYTPGLPGAVRVRLNCTEPPGGMLPGRSVPLAFHMLPPTRYSANATPKFGE